MRHVPFVLLLLTTNASAQVNIPMSRCINEKEYKALPVAWQTFAQARISSNGHRHIIQLSPPNGTRVLLYCADFKGYPQFAFATVHCTDNRFRRLQYEGTALVCSWPSKVEHWLPLKAPEVAPPK